MRSDRRLHVCYALVCNGWDRHARMLWVSAQSLRRHEPDARITIAADAGTRRTLDPRVASVADDVVEIDSSCADPRLRAFHLKTLLRQHVDGDYLYIDTDTLVVNPIADVLDLEAEVAAATDFNNDHEWFPPQLEGPYSRLGWPYPHPYYFNSGVHFMRDTPATRAFSKEWTRRWFLLVDEGMPGDQEAFVTALYASPVKWARLSKHFNCIVVKQKYRSRDARILHFFGSEEEQRGTIMEHLLQHLETTGTFDEENYHRCLRERHPWGPTRRAWQLWKSKNYIRASVVKARQIIGSADL
ncbi:MAG TPA: hypothetical protein VLV86_20515 [Vicinamibacterales bacterium]|nr:hypothetical protein [Vicinamibacterales bacterium]